MLQAPWRDSSTASMLAWSEPERQRLYADVCHDLDRLKASAESIRILDGADRYECLLAFLAAWETKTAVCVLPRLWPASWKDQIRKRIDRFRNEIPRDTFYILPTSGTTAEPKLVVVSRPGFESLMASLREIYRWPKGFRVALSFEPQFDPFIAMIFLTLGQEGTLVPLPEQEKFNVFEFIEREKTDVWASVPSLVSLNWDRKTQDFNDQLSLAIFTGEKLTSSLLARWKNFAKKCEVDNLYGPVEATVWATRFNAKNVNVKDVAIGSALGSLTFEIVDHELVLRGPQVATGYLTEGGLRKFDGVYPTGDLVVLEDENLYLTGRRDAQVKLLGQRVELELIESTFTELTTLPCVCAVDQNLRIFLAVREDIDFEDVGHRLREKLPPSHWPKFLVHIETDWPRTSSGKIDRQRLSAMIASGGYAT